MTRTVVKSARIETIKTPLKRPFITSLGRRDATVNVGLTLRLQGGAEGYGEASTSLALKNLTAKALEGALKRLCARAKGRDGRNSRALIDEAWAKEGKFSPAVAAFEAALLSALAAEAGLSLATWFGGALKSLKTDLTLSAWEDARMTEEAAVEAAQAGFETLKIKVGGKFHDDLSRIEAVRRGAPKARLILDGNQGLSPRGALKLLEAARKTGAKIDIFEQPVCKDDLRGMAFLVKRAGIPVAADESAATPEQAARVLQAGAATALNIKLAKSGLMKSLEMAALARASGAALMIGCMAETSRGLAASVHFALGTGFFRFVDLDSDVLLDEPASAKASAGWKRQGPIVTLAAL